MKIGKRKFNVPLDRKGLSKRKKKYRLWKRYLETKDASVYQEYCRCRNQVRRLTRKALKDQEKRVAKNASVNSKLFWKYVTSKTKLRGSIPNLNKSSKADPTKMTINDQEKAEVLAKFFSNVYIQEPDWTWILDDEKKASVKEELKIQITKKTIEIKLRELNVNKSPGPDLMHARVIKEISCALIDPFYIIFNLSLKLGKIPSAWKLASVIPIYKNKGSKQEAGNYRPISLTCIACRMMESIIRDSMMKYFKENFLLSEKQFGFVSGRSTVLQLLTVVDKWTEIMDRGGEIDVIYCDFQKAFDTVPHGRLLDLLDHYGIKDPILSWIKDFLQNRKQQVLVNGCKSREFSVLSGVPQGSVLGPLLFIVYINSLVEKSGHSELYLYADDLKVFKEIKSEDDIEKLQGTLDKLYDWTCYSLLRFHPDKCVKMRLSSSKSKQKKFEGNYNMDETKLKDVLVEKDLGVIFDNCLSFEEHIYSKVNKANGLVGMLRRSFEYLDKEMFRQLFIAIVRPHLEYGAPIWNPHTKKMINVIENVQRRASRMIPGLGKLSYKDRLKAIKLPTLQYRRYRGDMIETYKLTHGLYEENISRNFINNYRDSAPGERAFRSHKYTFRKESCKKDIRKFFFKNRITEQWNNLPVAIVDAPSLNSFKRRLDKLWSIDDIMYNYEIDLNEITSNRRTRYIAIEEEQ